MATKPQISRQRRALKARRLQAPFWGAHAISGNLGAQAQAPNVMSVTVRTQTELDTALAAGKPTIYIQSDPGIALHLHRTGSSRVVARGSSRVEARGSSRVEARDFSYVEARDSSFVVASDSSRVVAWGFSHVVARDSSRVEASGSSLVVARGFSRVEASAIVAVYLYSRSVTLSGGVVIDMTAVDETDPQTPLSPEAKAS